MQVNGVGSGNVHSADSHQVTNCVHEHRETKTSHGGMDALSLSAKTQQGNENASGEAYPGSFGIGELLRTIREGARKLFGMDGKGTEERDASLPDGSASAVFGEGVKETEKKAAGNAQETVNPYFIALERSKGVDTLWQRFKIKVYTASGHLAKRFGRENGLQTAVKKDPRQQENLKRHSHYKGEDGELECVVTDESYLMDSYDRTGNYAKLGQESRRTGRKQGIDTLK